MEAKEFEARKEELVNECDVAPQFFERVMPRLEQFMEPFIDSLVRREQVEHASTFVQGLLSDLEHKNSESIAYRFEQVRGAVHRIQPAPKLRNGAAHRSDTAKQAFDLLRASIHVDHHKEHSRHSQQYSQVVPGRVRVERKGHGLEDGRSIR